MAWEARSGWKHHELGVHLEHTEKAKWPGKAVRDGNGSGSPSGIVRRLSRSPMDINVRNISSTSIGGGFNGRCLGDCVARRPCLCFPTVLLVKAMWPTRATIKAHSTHPLHPRPYGSLGLLPVSVASPFEKILCFFCKCTGSLGLLPVSVASPYLRLTPVGRPSRSPGPLAVSSYSHFKDQIKWY